MIGALLGCADGGREAVDQASVVELEATVESLQDSLNALESENTELMRQVATLRGELEDAESVLDFVMSDKEEWAKGKDEEWLADKGDKLNLQDGSVVERTASLAEDAGGTVHFINHAGRGDRTVLVTPQSFDDGETPLVVSLHGYGGNSADHAAYFPLHERVNSDGFALLLPTGSPDREGLPAWNPTDHCCEGGKSGDDDVGYLTDLVAEARKLKEFGPIYFFGYSNGGFMSHHMACKALPGLHAVASLAGTSYVEDSSCEGAPPVSVLHIHGTEDDVIKFDGDATETDPNGESAFYASAHDMVARWSRIAGCEWSHNSQPYASYDFDQYVPGAETRAYRQDASCAEGISIELWVGEGSSHSPGYGEAFMDALVEWLLSQG